jgi:hypothetical protein
MSLRFNAVGKEYCTLHFNEQNHEGNHVSENGSIPVQCVTLDGDIQEPITFLKMDIEGAEQDAILGAVEHIKNDKPKLGISLYHRYEDIWKIPLMIDEICPGYSFAMQYNGPAVAGIIADLTLLGKYE